VIAVDPALLLMLFVVKGRLRKIKKAAREGRFLV
jgi:hypothetical protein